MRSIAFATIKGGVGKTTLAVSTAAALADAGKKVLFVDLDPQAHGSLVLGLEPEDRLCVADAFGPRPRCSLDDVLVQSAKRPNLTIAPACARMAGLERELFGWGHRLQMLPRALNSLKSPPEVVIIDTPPSIGAFTETVLSFVDLIAAPVPTGAFALQGLGEIEAAWRGAREGGGQLMVVVNLWDRRTNATNEAMEQALSELTVPVARNRVVRSEAINQAGLSYEVVFDVNKNAKGVEELRLLARELAQKVGLSLKRSRRAA